MARVRNNVLIQGLSGKVGELVIFRQLNGETIIAKAPQQFPKEPSPAQKENRARFQQANLYWKGVKAKPELLQAYTDAESPGKWAQILAIGDFLHAPDIDEIDLRGYTGQPSQVIRVKVVDNFRVTSVTVEIHNEVGTLVEQGLAAPEPDGVHWRYLTTASNETISGDKITVSATDNPANVTLEGKRIE